MTGIELISKERQEQIEKHNISIEDDLINNKAHQLSESAAVLATEKFPSDRSRLICMPKEWNDEACLKMCKKDRFNRLIIAGALIAAELDKMINQI
jgi:hypothetical protein